MGGRDSTGGGCWGRRVPNGQTDTPQKRQALLAYRKVVLSQSSADAWESVESGPREGPACEGERGVGSRCGSVDFLLPPLNELLN